MSTLQATVQFIKKLPFQELVIPDYQRPYVWQLKELLLKCLKTKAFCVFQTEDFGQKYNDKSRVSS